MSVPRPCPSDCASPTSRVQSEKGNGQSEMQLRTLTARLDKMTCDSRRVVFLSLSFPLPACLARATTIQASLWNLQLAVWSYRCILDLV